MPDQQVPNAPSACLPAWLPPSGIRSVPAAPFDAVHVSRLVGDPAIRLLGNRSGPVIAQAVACTLMWLVAPGSTAGWDLPHVYRHPAGSRILVPASDVAPTWWMYWKIPPRGDCLTDQAALHNALAEAIDARDAMEAGR